MLAVLILIYFKNFISANIASGGVNSVSFDKMDKTKVGFNLLSIDNQETLKQHLKIGLMMHGFAKETGSICYSENVSKQNVKDIVNCSSYIRYLKKCY